MPNDLQLSDQDEVLLESLVLAASDNVTRAPGSDRSQFAPTRRRVFVETDGNENVYLGTGNAWVDVSENTGLLSSLFGGGDGNFDSVDTGSATVTNQVDAGSVNTDDIEIGNEDFVTSGDLKPLAQLAFDTGTGTQTTTSETYVEVSNTNNEPIFDFSRIPSNATIKVGLICSFSRSDISQTAFVRLSYEGSADISSTELSGGGSSDPQVSSLVEVPDGDPEPFILEAKTSDSSFETVIRFAQVVVYQQL